MLDLFGRRPCRPQMLAGDVRSAGPLLAGPAHTHGIAHRTPFRHDKIKPALAGVYDNRARRLAGDRSDLRSMDGTRRIKQNKEKGDQTHTNDGMSTHSSLRLRRSI